MKPIPRIESHHRAADQYTMHTKEGAEKVARLIRERRLRHCDSSVLNLLAAHMNLFNGQIRTRLSIIGEELGMSKTQVFASFKRLRDEMLAVRCVDSNRDTVFLIDPHVVAIGTRQQRSFRWQQYKYAIESGGELPGRNWVPDDVEEPLEPPLA